MENKKTNLSTDEILENLKTIKFDRNKHTSLHQAVQEFLSLEKYANIMNGIVTDTNDLKEVQIMLEAFKKLKDYEEKIISGVIFDEEIGCADEELDEFVVVYRDDKNEWGYSTYHKNLQDKCYEPVCEYDKYAYCDIYIRDGKVYNLKHKIIFEESFNQIEKVCKGILKIDDYYVTVDGIVIPSSLQIDKIVHSSISSSLKYEILKNIASGIDLPYLKEEILDISNVCVSSKISGCISYYKLDGKKIISNDQNGYCYIEEHFKKAKDERTIISIGKFDTKLNTVYGYYDLDQCREVGSCKFLDAKPWIGYGAIANTSEHLCFVNKNGKVTEYEVSVDSVDKFPIFVCDVDFDYKRCGNFKREVFKNRAFYVTYYIASSLSKITDDLFIVAYQLKDREEKYRPKVVKALITNLDTKPTIIGKFYRDIMLQSITEKRFLALDIDEDVWKILSFDGQETEIKLNNDKVDKKNFYPLELSFKNSLFLDNPYKEIVSLLENKEQTKYSLISINSEIEKIHNGYLSNVTFEHFESNPISDDVKVKKVVNINEEGTALLTLDSEFSECIYDKFGNYFVVGKNMRVHTLDVYDHVLLEFYNNDKSYSFKCDYRRKLLIDKTGRLLIGLSKNIELVDDKYYIVTRCDDKKQVFDCNAIPLTLPSDDARLVEKRYIDKNGMVKKVEKKLLVTNGGCEYLLDDDQDYLISINEEYNNVFEEVKKLTLK